MITSDANRNDRGRKAGFSDSCARAEFGMGRERIGRFLLPDQRSERHTHGKLQFPFREISGLCPLRGSRSPVTDVCVKAAVCELRMVEHVKSVDTELSRETLAQPEVFIHARIPSVNTGASDRVAAKGTGAAENPIVHWWKREVSRNHALAAPNFRSDRPSNVRAIARGSVDAEVKRRTGTQGDDIVPLPPTDNVVESRWNIAGVLLALAEGKLVEGTEDEEVANILIGTSPVEVQ